MTESEAESSESEFQISDLQFTQVRTYVPTTFMRTQVVYMYRIYVRMHARESTGRCTHASAPTIKFQKTP